MAYFVAKDGMDFAKAKLYAVPHFAGTNGRLVGNELGLAGYWSFNEGAGETANDISSNGNDGTITITASGIGTLEYSIDNGATFLASNSFTGFIFFCSR